MYFESEKEKGQKTDQNDPSGIENIPGSLSLSWLLLLFRFSDNGALVGLDVTEYIRLA